MAPIAHFSPQNLLTFHLIYHLIWTRTSIGGKKVTTAVDDLSVVASYIGSSLGAFWAANRRNGRVRWGWSLIGLSGVSLTVGGCIWSWYEIVLNKATPFPSVADAAYLTAYPLAIAGIVLISGMTIQSGRGLRTVLDGLIVAGGLFGVSWSLAIETIYKSAAGTSVLSQVIGLAYPLGDVAIGTILILVMARAPRQVVISLGIFAVGMFANAISDTLFAYLTAVGAYTRTLKMVDAGWVAGYLLMGLSGFVAGRGGTAGPSRDDHATSKFRIVLPYIPMIGVGAVLVKVGLTKQSTLAHFW